MFTYFLVLFFLVFSSFFLFTLSPFLPLSTSLYLFFSLFKNQYMHVYGVAFSNKNIKPETLFFES